MLNDQQVQVVDLEGKQMLVIEIPAAMRQQKPVYLKNQPMKETYMRLHEGDRVCSEETVRRMMAEQVEDSRDSKVLKHYTIADIDMSSLKAYRQLFSAAKPEHPFLALDTLEFLRAIKAKRIDREMGEELAFLCLVHGMPFRMQTTLFCGLYRAS